jgi:hypothetical protein
MLCMLLNSFFRLSAYSLSSTTMREREILPIGYNIIIWWWVTPSNHHFSDPVHYSIWFFTVISCSLLFLHAYKNIYGKFSRPFEYTRDQRRRFAEVVININQLSQGGGSGKKGECHFRGTRATGEIKGWDWFLSYPPTLKRKVLGLT